jgi:hypothetical protein
MMQSKTKLKWIIIVRWGTLHSYHSCVRGVSMGYRLDSWGWIPGMDRCFSTPHCPDWVWGPPSLPSNEYRGSFLGGKTVGAWSWGTTRFDKGWNCQEQARINEAIRDKIRLKSKCEVEYTPFLSFCNKRNGIAVGNVMVLYRNMVYDSTQGIRKIPLELKLKYRN